MKLRAWFSVLLSLALVTACSRPPLTSVEKAMRPVEAPELSDDLPLEPLAKSARVEADFLERKNAQGELRFGERIVAVSDYARGLRRFADLVDEARKSGDRKAFFSAVAREFEFREVYGDKKWGDIFVTSYYEPRIQGALKPTGRFTQPLYRAPDDLLSLDLTLWDPAKFNQDTRKLRARLDGSKLLPYFNREEIDSKQALKGKKLEICYADPIDAFVLQIQGSGVVDLGNGKALRLNYAEQNGRPYDAVGKYLRDRIPAEKLNLHTIEAVLRLMPREEMQKILNNNPSYVFFRVTEESAVTYLGVEATDGRTIATDRHWFPKGALAFMSFEKPVFNNPDWKNLDSLVPVRTETASRFVLDQDIGGAISGSGRVDLFWGRGEEGKLYASAVKGRGRLYYLLPKPGQAP